MVEDLIGDATEVAAMATAEVAGAVVEDKAINKISRKQMVIFSIIFILVLIALVIYLW